MPLLTSGLPKFLLLLLPSIPLAYFTSTTSSSFNKAFITAVRFHLAMLQPAIRVSSSQVQPLALHLAGDLLASSQRAPSAKIHTSKATAVHGAGHQVGAPGLDLLRHLQSSSVGICETTNSDSRRWQVCVFPTTTACTLTGACASASQSLQTICTYLATS